MPTESTNRLIEFRANPTQKNFVESRAQADLFACRMGEGKTAALAWAIWYHTRHNPGARWAIVRDTWENLRDTTQTEIFKWFPPGIFGDYKASEKKFVWKAETGLEGEILFMGMDDPDDASKLQSRELAGIAMDEPAPAAESGGIDELIFDVALSRLRQPNMNWYAIKLAENNPDETHWTYRRFVEPGTEGFVCWQTSEAENLRNLPENYYEKIAQAWAHRPDLKRRFLEGKFGFQQIGRAVTPEWSSEIHLTGYLEPVRGCDLIMSWDGGLCYDDQTDVLTDEGWKRFADLHGRELLATRNQDSGEIEYQKPIRLIRRSYVGPMVEYSDHSIDFCVTPEHQVPVEREVHGKWGTRKVTADWLAERKRHHCRVDLTGDWQGAPGNPFGWDDEVFAGFMGWWVAEGTVAKQYGRISVYQNNPDERLDSILQSTGLRWRPTYGHCGKFAGWETYDRELAEYLREACQGEKRIPREVLNLPPEALKAFYDGFIAGDGYIRHRRGHTETTAFTIFDSLAGDLQELGVKLGYSVRIRREAGTTSVIREAGREERVITNDGGNRIAFRQYTHSYMNKPFERRQYTGEVFCATVPNGTLWVRRNGKVHCNGNSPTCVITQVTPLGDALILEAHVGEHIGMYELITQIVKPRLASVYEGFRWRHTGDPNLESPEQSSSQNSAALVIQRALGGPFIAGPVSEEARTEPLRALLGRQRSGRGVLQVDRYNAKAVWHALRGGWHYHVDRNGNIGGIVKDEHSHPGDCMGYFCAYAFPLAKMQKREGNDVQPQQATFFGSRRRSGGIGSPGARPPKEARTIGED